MNILSKWTAKGRMAAVLVLGAVIALSSGCKEEDPPAISVNQQMFRVSTDSHELALRVMSNADWTASYSTGAKYDPNTNTGWITLSREKGRGSYDLTIFVEPYKGLLNEGRQAVITFTAAGAMATVIINQSEQNTILQVIPSEFEIGGEGGNVYFTVLSNTSWTIYGDADWATISPKTGTGNATITIDVDNNPGHSAASAREVFYQVSAGYASEIVTEQFHLMQKGLPDPTLILGQELVHFPAKTASVTPPITAKVPVITNVTLPAGTTPLVSVGDAWLTASVSASAPWIITITPQDNLTFSERTSVITVTIPNTDATGGYIMKQIRVVQAAADAPTLKVSRDLVTFAAKDPSAADLSVTETVGYIATGGTPVVVDYPGWFASAPAVSGGSAGTITMVAKPNYGVERTGVVHAVVTLNGATADAYINVVQAAVDAFTFEVTPTAFTADKAGDNFNVLAYSSAEMEIVAVLQKDGNWININPAAGITFPFAATTVGFGASEATLPLVVDANPGAEERTGTIEVIAISGSKSYMQTVTVTQPGVGGPELQILPPAVTVSKVTGDTADLVVLNGDGVTISCGIAPAGWVTATPDALTDPTSIELEVTADAVAADRTATLYVYASKGGKTQLIEVKITQPGTGSAGLIIENMLYEVEAAGRSIVIPVVALNGSSWSVTSTDDTNPSMYSTAPGKTGDTVTAVVDENPSSAVRYSYIYLLATNGDSTMPYTIVVKQAGLVPIAAELSSANIGVQWDLGVADSKIVINNLPAGTTAAMIEADVDVTWLTLGTPVIAGNTATIEVEVTGANPKVSTRDARATIVVTRAPETKTLVATITQEAAPGPEVKLVSDKLVIPASGAGNPFTIPFYNYSSNVTYTAYSDDPAFVTATISGNSLVVTKVVPIANDLPNSVTTQVHVIAKAGGVETNLTLDVEQLGAGLPVLEIDGSNIYGPASQPGAVYFINPNLATVTVLSKPAWLSAATLSGGNQGAYNFTVDANPTSEDRSGQIAFLASLSAGNQAIYYVDVLQYGLAPLSINVVPSFAITDSAAGTLEDIFQVTGVPASGVTVTAESLKTWLATSAVSAANTFSVGKDVNDTAYPRFGTILVEATRGDEIVNVTVNVMQFAKTFVMPTANVNPTSLQFAGDQSTPEVKTVTIQNTDTAYTYDIVAPDWVNTSAITVGGTFEVSVLTNNTASTPRTGTVTLHVHNGDKTQTINIPVTQQTLAMPTANVNPNSLLFVAASAPAQTVTIQNTDPAYTYDVVAPSWLTVSAVAVGGTFTAVPVADNATATPLVGDITLYVHNGNNTQTITIPVVQKALLAPIFPATSSVIFSSTVGGATAAMPVDLIGFTNPPYIFTYTQEGDWFTVVPPASPMEIYPNTAWNGTSPRTGKVNVTIRSSADPAYKSEFTINVVQQGTFATNITYAPDRHVVGVNGGTVFSQFDNVHPSLTLAVASATDLDFVSSAVLSGNKLTLLVQPNMSAAFRTAVIEVVAYNGGNIVASYPVTVVQDGTAAAAPTFFAQVTNSPVVVTVADGNNYQANVSLAAGYSIVSAGVSSGPNPGWLLSTTPGAGNVIDILTDTSDGSFPTTGTATETIKIVVEDNLGNPYNIYFQIVAFGNTEPLIGATITPDSGVIAPAATDLSAITTPVIDLNGATVGAVPAIFYNGSGTWLDSAVFDVDAVGNVSVTGIDPNTTIFPRSATITFNLTKVGSQSQNISYRLTQNGLPAVASQWSDTYSAAATATTLNAAPVNSDGATVGTITDSPAWLTSAVANGSTIDFVFPVNNTSTPNVGLVKFTMVKAGAVTQNCSFYIVQGGVTLSGAVVAPVNSYAYTAGTYNFVVSNLSTAITAGSFTVQDLSGSGATFTPTAGALAANQQTVSFNLTANSGNAPRIWLVSFTVAGTTVSTVVTQNYLAVPAITTFFGPGGLFTSVTGGNRSATGTGSSNTAANVFHPSGGGGSSNRNTTLAYNALLPEGTTVSVNGIGGGTAPFNNIGYTVPAGGPGSHTINWTNGNAAAKSYTVTITYPNGAVNTFTMYATNNNNP